MVIIIFIITQILAVFKPMPIYAHLAKNLRNKWAWGCPPPELTRCYLFPNALGSWNGAMTTFGYIFGGLTWERGRSTCTIPTLRAVMSGVLFRHAMIEIRPNSPRNTSGCVRNLSLYSSITLWRTSLTLLIGINRSVTTQIVRQPAAYSGT